MKLRRIMSAMLAASLVTSTVAFADEVIAEQPDFVNFAVSNDKGTYTFSDAQLEAYLDYMVEVNGMTEDTTVVNEPGYIFGEDSTFTVADCERYNLNQIWQVSVEYIDVQADADGNISMRQLLHSVGYSVSASHIWTPSYITGNANGGEGDTVTASRIINAYLYAPWAETTDFADVDIIQFYFNYGEDEVEYNDMGLPIQPEESKWSGEWVFTESGAAMLSELAANESENVPDTSSEAYEVDVTSALSAEDIADVIAANADSDVVINGENGVSFKFAKGTMTTVDGVEAYDFTSTISTDLADAASAKLTEDNFVLSIDYAYSGKLPAKAEITIPVGAEYVDKTLYYSRVLENGVKLIDSAKVDENGYITVTQDSCSDYILTTEDISADAAGSTDGADSDDKNSADTGAQGVAAAAGIALAAGAAVLFSRKRK
ncbi:MAG: hypothetical protein E7485_07455 [Ruminococcaceae bacterium]|nr:hypothetical protein [Oscillospiraceae bacterium]